MKAILITAFILQTVHSLLLSDGPFSLTETVNLGLILSGDYSLDADAYYELKDEGYYSPDVYESYVNQPIFQLTLGMQFQFEALVLGVFQIRGDHFINLAKLIVGLQYFFSTRVWNEACLQGFMKFEALSLEHKVKTNMVKCGDDLLDKVDVYRHKMNMCNFDDKMEQVQDLGPLEFAAVRYEAWPMAICI